MKFLIALVERNWSSFRFLKKCFILHLKRPLLKRPSPWPRFKCPECSKILQTVTYLYGGENMDLTVLLWNILVNNGFINFFPEEYLRSLYSWIPASHFLIISCGKPHLTTMLLITVVATVIFMVTFEGQGDAGAWGHAAELVGWVTGRSG